MANFGVKARRESVTFTIDQTNRRAVDDTPALGTTVHYDWRDDKEANEYRKSNLPGDIDIHGVSPPGLGRFPVRHVDHDTGLRNCV